ncbi:MAG TPA: hypothetical protein VN519_06350 [Bryobacteraceae bacterium]|nr:hypothetical protein [Bryobacteraceae bacterium]
MDETGSLDEWDCDYCNIKFYVPSGTALKDSAALTAQPDPRVKGLVEALERIERWFGEFPPTGRTWDDKPGGEPMSYAAVNGSNGERDFMRGIARAALAAAKGEPAEGDEDMDPFGDHVETVCRDCGCNPCDCERMAELDAAYHEEYGPGGIDPELLIPPGLGLSEDAR